MSRAKGYKCFNIKCGSCIGKTLCGEPEDTALVCVDRVIGKPMTNAQKIRSMNDEELAAFFCPEKPRNSPWCEPIGRTRCGKAPCRKCMLKWLQQPVEGE